MVEESSDKKRFEAIHLNEERYPANAGPNRNLAGIPSWCPKDEVKRGYQETSWCYKQACHIRDYRSVRSKGFVVILDIRDVR